MIELESPQESAVDELVERLAVEDLLGQLLDRSGRSVALGSEDGEPKLDWVDGVAKALAHPEWLAAVEQDAEAVVANGIRHVIWAGMGGSVQTVHSLRRIGFLSGPSLAVHPLDSTDPAALNAILAAVVGQAGPEAEALRSALAATMMIGVSMGMTSEEPITHLEWFDGLLHSYEVPAPADHIQVMTIPGSYLAVFARERGSARRPIQLDGGNGTPGRMSAPATRVFLLPLALTLADSARDETGHRGGKPAVAQAGELLGAVLERGQRLHRVRPGLTRTERAALTKRHPLIRLGAHCAHRASAGRNKLVLLLPPAWKGIAPWIEQLCEESLGKGGKGLLIFYDQDPQVLSRFGDDCLFLEIRPEGLASSGAALPPPAEQLRQDGREVLVLHLPVEPQPGLPARLSGVGELAGLMLGLELTVGTFGYLHDIVFAGQPAVEGYKRYAREARADPEQIAYPDTGAGLARTGSVALSRRSLAQQLSETELQAEVGALGASSDDAAAIVAAVLRIARRQGWLRYVDLTWNGLMTPAIQTLLRDARRTLINDVLSRPGKVRTGPADYHSTEQSETDGPPELVSIRLVSRQHDAATAGDYDDTFLHAQAHGTWRAMEDAGRWVLMAWLPDTSERSLADLASLFSKAAQLVTE